MSKKDFSGGLNTLLGESGYKKPEKESKKTPSRKEGLGQDEIRATYILPESYVEKLKLIAYWDRLSIKESATEMIKQYVDSWEEKNGSVKPKPDKKI
jgi:hypothetical protein